MKRSIFYFISLLSVQVNLVFGETILDSSIVDKNRYTEISRPSSVKILKKKGEYTLSSLFRDDDEIAWARRFDIAELGGVDDSHITYKLLEQKGIFDIKHHIGYDWMPGFYYYTDGKNRKFVDWLYENRRDATLNPDGPFLHCKKNGYDWCKDYYYNFGSKEVFVKRVDNLVSDMKKRGFNGLFFDWASGSFILSKEYRKMKKRFEELNPKREYFDLVGEFYKALKSRDIFVVTNQAFRKEKYLLRYVTYDMTESYITTDIKKSIKIQIAGRGWVDTIKVTNYYPIYKNSKGLKDSLHFIDVLTSYKEKYSKYGFKNFIYLNYLAPEYEKIYESAKIYKLKKPKNGIYFSYAMGKLTDNIVYAEIPENKRLERDEVYFYDLGKPLGESYLKIKNMDSYVRFYTNGFVLASAPMNESLYIELHSEFIPKKRYIYDAFNDSWLLCRNSKVVVKLDFKRDSFSDKYLPAGRVYLYNQNTNLGE